MAVKKLHTLSIIIPCYNEENTLREIIGEILSVDTCRVNKDIIIVDDCSSDGSRQIIKDLTKKHREIRAVYNSSNQGKGSSLKAGFKKSYGDVVIVQDADREYDPRDYLKLLNIFAEDRADIVFGSRFSGGSPRRVTYLANTIANKIMTRLSAILNGLYVTDIHTCYIMFDGDWIRNAVPKLTSRRFGFNPEIVAMIAKQKDKLRICETSISYYGRTRQEGKKIGWRDGISAIYQIIYYNLKRNS